MIYTILLSLRKTFAIVILAFTIMTPLTGQGNSSTPKATKPLNGNDLDLYATRAKQILSSLTLTDKVGEMTQFALDVISVGQPYNAKDPHELDTAKLRHVLLDLRAGSILNVAGHAYTREHWHDIIKTIQDIATKQKPSGIPVIYGIDAIHGNNYTIGSTLFPQEITMAASWDPAIAEKAASITAYETRASWIPWNFSPVLDIGRDPRWPRFWETFGEDVFLASKFSEAYIKGYQGNDPSSQYNVAACMKHFLGYSGPLTGKDRTQSQIPDRQLLEYYVPTFQKAVDAGALTIMINSGDINGIPVHCNKPILTDLLRTQMGFKGLAVTDWEDINNLVTRHKVAIDFKDAIRQSINAGIDMAMVPMDTRFPILLKELVEEGKVPMARIDEAVERILKVKLALGLFEKPYPQNETYPDFASAKHTEINYKAALDCITLLKNEKNTLPLSKNKKVLVTGFAANTMNSLNGGWNRTWQGNNPAYDAEADKSTILEAIQNKIGASNVIYSQGISFNAEIDIDAAVKASSDADAIIVCLGEMSYTETPGDIYDLQLPDVQRKLTAAFAGTGKPVIIVLLEGRPRVLNTIEPYAQSILLGYLPGNEGGRAIAEILFGDYNPSGKLPFTYPRYSNALYTYDIRGTDLSGPLGVNPQWPFGFGLSYTQFEYSSLNVDASSFSGNAKINIEVTVKNKGSRSGKEVVQLYVSDLVASIAPSVKRLRGFQKVELEPGASKTVSFSLSAQDLAFVGQDNKWITEEGEFEINIGGLKKTVMYGSPKK